MERDELIIWVYLWVCEEMEKMFKNLNLSKRRLRGRGFAPALSDEEALTIELCGEMLRLNSDKAIYSHFKTHYQSWFPALRDRPAFVRQCANLWRVKRQFQQQLLQSHFVWEQSVQPIDTVPLPVCAKARCKADRCFAGIARKSFCASKDVFYYGFKLGLRITNQGLIAYHTLLEANTNDCRHLDDLVEELVVQPHTSVPSYCVPSYYVPVDKGFFDPALWKTLWQRGVHIVGHGPQRIDHHRPPQVVLPDEEEKLFAWLRKKVETVASLLCGRFSIDRIRVHDLWHFEHRLLRKILAYNLLVSLNIRLQRNPLDLDGIVRD